MIVWDSDLLDAYADVTAVQLAAQRVGRPPRGVALELLDSLFPRGIEKGGSALDVLDALKSAADAL